jgi:hypothetical protein
MTCAHHEDWEILNSDGQQFYQYQKPPLTSIIEKKRKKTT